MVANVQFCCISVYLYVCLNRWFTHHSSGVHMPSFSDTQPSGVLTEVDIKWKIKERLVGMESKLTDIYGFSVAAVIILLGGAISSRDYEGSIINEMLFKELTSHLKLTMWVLKLPQVAFHFKFKFVLFLKGCWIHTLVMSAHARILQHWQSIKIVRNTYRMYVSLDITGMDSQITKLSLK